MNLLAAAQLCSAAYDGVSVGDHSYSIGAGGEIGIAGTANFENVLEDGAVWVTTSPSGALAHAGVMHAFNELEAAILPHIPKSGAVFCGHSLGGGIAQIFCPVH